MNAIAASAVRVGAPLGIIPAQGFVAPLLVSQSLIGWDLLCAGPLPGSPAAPVHHFAKGFPGPAGGRGRLVVGTWPAQGDGT